MIKTKLQQLQHLLGAPVTAGTMKKAEWESIGGKKFPEIGDYVQLEGGCLLATKIETKEIGYIRTEAELTPLEKELLKWALQQQSGKPSPVAGSDQERQARRLGEWIEQCILSGETRVEVPDWLETRGKLFDGMIPFLLLNDQTDEREPSYAELEKVLRSFISDEMMLVPLQEREWLILGSDRLLAEIDSGEGDVIDREETKEALFSLATGLQQMFTEQWGGECYVAVGEPMIPTESLIQAVGMLRDTIYLGRKYHVGTQVHVPWAIHLERLLNEIPDPAKARFMEQMMPRLDLFNDAETVSTLDAFFAMDCNVSETAKRLFIHRNTLLYRLDKLKQETGLDVRSFNDAVLVRIMLLLYKVTKRK
ncbi:helix-turn-helix domain-containing protein [Cohnella algarum]|nr:helix-turn-helix domain-containing protein [Cohnella algarum]